jgi:hypothetical protein
LFEVVACWYKLESELDEPFDGGMVYRRYQHVAGPFCTWEEASAVAEQFRA